MQYTTLILAALTAFSIAAPLTPRSSTWTVQSFTRTCASNTCTYSYSINTNDGTTPTACKYNVVGTNGTPASRQPYNNVACGDFLIGSSWSGQFGPGNGFQTLSVVANHSIIYPAYSDQELQNGVAVTPDKSYPVMSV